MSVKNALITGITGQDGSYLAEFLLEKKYKVYGLIRRSSTVNFERISHIQRDIELLSGDLLDQKSLTSALEDPPQLLRPPVQGAAFLVEVGIAIVDGTHLAVLVTEHLIHDLAALFHQTCKMRAGRSSQIVRRPVLKRHVIVAGAI